MAIALEALSEHANWDSKTDFHMIYVFSVTWHVQYVQENTYTLLVHKLLICYYRVQPKKYFCCMSSLLVKSIHVHTYLYSKTHSRCYKSWKWKETLATAGFTWWQALELVWKRLRVRVSIEVTHETTMNPAVTALCIVGNSSASFL